MKSKIAISCLAFLLLIMFDVNAQTFLHNKDQAKTTATEKNQPILIVFSDIDLSAMESQTYGLGLRHFPAGGTGLNYTYFND